MVPDESSDPDSRTETPICGITTALPFQSWAGRCPLEKQGITVFVVKDVGRGEAWLERDGTCLTVPLHFAVTQTGMRSATCGDGLSAGAFSEDLLSPA